MPKATTKSRKVLNRIIDVMFIEAPGDLCTNQIALLVGLDPGLVGAILSRSAWATRRRRVRLNRNRMETRWAASDAAMIDYARRHASLLVRRAALMAAKGVEVGQDNRGRVTMRCGSITSILHAD